jgi:nucleolar protein 53
MPTSRKRKLREKEAVADLEAAIDRGATRARTTQKSDQDLFVLDGKPAKGRGGRAAAGSDKRQRLEKKAPASHEQRLVAELSKRIDPAAAKKKAAGPKSTGQARLKGRKKGFDLWDRAEPTNATTRRRSNASGDGWDMTTKASDGSSAAEKSHPLYTHGARNSRRTARPTLKSTRHAVNDVEVAVGGQSYHPEFEQYAGLMSKAVTEEKGRRAERAAKNKRYDFVPSEHMLDAMLSSSDDDDDDDDDEAQGEGSDGEDSDGKTSNMKKMEKLTVAQRNKIARRKKREWDEKVVRREKKFLKSINTAHDVTHALKKKEKESKKKIAEAAEVAAAKLLERPKPKRGGKVVEDLPTEVALPEELSGCMRLLKPEGHVAKDRFASLLRRNRFEAGSKAKPRFKERVKARPRYKDDPKWKDV